MRELTREELRAEQLSVLNAVAHFCDEQCIPYYLYAGSLLGAVRHKGYIPWDDDIDICMMREDYDRFIQAFQAPGFLVVSPEQTRGYYLASAKVLSNRTVLMESVRCAFPLGVNIDVFPLDDIPDDPEECARLDRKVSRYRNLLDLKNLKPNRDRTMLKRLVVRLGGILLLPVPRLFLLRRIHNLGVSCHGRSDCHRVADVVCASARTLSFQKSAFYETVKFPFEGQLYDAPAGWDHVLQQEYGDYWELPPESKRVTHHAFAAFWKE